MLVSPVAAPRLAPVLRPGTHGRGKAHRAWTGGGLAILSCLAAACATPGQLTTLDDPACKTTVKAQLQAVLLEQGERPEVAERLAVNTTTVLATGSLGPRPFGVASPSGADYSFFVQPKEAECLLRLYGRQKGFTRFSNNLTYLATRSLAGCRCSD